MAPNYVPFSFVKSSISTTIKLFLFVVVVALFPVNRALNKYS